MEFSILIPVYNVEIRLLVERLYKQAIQLTDKFEILLIDDCSDLSIAYLNKKIVDLPNVRFQLLSENVGRSKIRNQLFEAAQYETCLIMDCDVTVDHPDFLSNYLNTLTKDNVVVGGHQYVEMPPAITNRYLHWNYGREKEVQALKNRLKNPYSSFMTNCFAIHKNTFQNIQFDEQLSQYGHEDTLFGIELEKKEIPIVHIDNPVIHLGLDDKLIFLDKQRKAIQNLAALYQNLELRPFLKKKSKLIRYASLPMAKQGALFSKNWAIKELQKDKPSLKALQIQKLNWWFEFSK